MSSPMRIPTLNPKKLLGKVIMYSLILTSCIFTLNYFVAAFTPDPIWPNWIQVVSPYFFAFFGLCCADLGLIYWFSEWTDLAESPMQKWVAGVMTALTGSVAILTTIMGVLNLLTDLAEFTDTIRLVVTVITTFLIVCVMVAYYGMAFFSRESYIKSAASDKVLLTFEKDVEKEASMLAANIHKQVVAQIQGIKITTPTALSLADESAQPKAAPLQQPRAIEAKAAPAKQVPDQFSQLFGDSRGKVSDTVARTSGQPSLLQPPVSPPVKPTVQMVVRIQGRDDKFFQDPVAASLYADTQKGGVDGEIYIYQNGRLIKTVQGTASKN